MYPLLDEEDMQMPMVAKDESHASGILFPRYKIGFCHSADKHYPIFFTGRPFTCVCQVTEAVKTAVLFYNSEHPHSSIDWHTPDEVHQMEDEMKRHWHSWCGCNKKAKCDGCIKDIS